MRSKTNTIPIRSMRRFAIIAAVVLVLFLGIIVHLRRNQPSPYPDVVFVEDHPGANGRHVTYTPVLRADPSVRVGEIVGADYGRIYFRDIDGDGQKETIVETQPPIIDTGEFYSDTKEVLRYIRADDGVPRMENIASEVRKNTRW